MEVDTWYCTEGRNAVRRDWTVKDVNTGEIIAVATRLVVFFCTCSVEIIAISIEGRIGVHVDYLESVLECC